MSRAEDEAWVWLVRSEIAAQKGAGPERCHAAKYTTTPTCLILKREEVVDKM